jgi:LacI family transcriptional regulator
MLSQLGNASLDGAYLAGLSRAAVELNLSLIAHHFQEKECENIFDPVYQPRALRSGSVQGVVLLHRWPLGVVKKLSNELPMVSIIHTYRGVKMDVVSIDESEGMISLVSHLMAAGHRQIGFFGFCRSMSWARSRLGAYVAALAGMDLEYRPENKVEVSLADALAESPVHPFPAAQPVLERFRQGVRAWICSSENLAYSLCQEVLSYDLKIPEQIAITGFHASSISPLPGLPVLTTTVSSPEDLGAAALRQLVVHLDNPRESHRSILLPCTYFQGQSTPSVESPTANEPKS